MVWRDAGLLTASLHSWFCLEQEKMFSFVEQPKHARYCCVLDRHTLSNRASQRWVEAETQKGKATCPSHAVLPGRAGSAGWEDSSTGAVSLNGFSMGHYGHFLLGCPAQGRKCSWLRVHSVMATAKNCPCISKPHPCGRPPLPLHRAHHSKLTKSGPYQQTQDVTQRKLKNVWPMNGRREGRKGRREGRREGKKEVKSNRTGCKPQHYHLLALWY